MRKLFAETTEAKVRGYLPGRFSFNVKGGRCEACSGDGTIKIEMNFLPDVYVPCEVCHGARYNRETLEVHFKGKTIAEVLDMPIEEAVGVLRGGAGDLAAPAHAGRRRASATSGSASRRPPCPAARRSGSSWRRELQKRSTGRTVYVLDEPTTGLHFEDIRKLLVVLQGLADKGNTVIVIEHNLDVIKTADWVVDMGPEGGSGGGTVVAEGTPEQVAAVPASHTGVFLKDVLQDAPAGTAAAPGSAVPGAAEAGPAEETAAAARAGWLRWRHGRPGWDRTGERPQPGRRPAVGGRAPVSPYGGGHDAGQASVPATPGPRRDPFEPVPG